LTPEFFLFHGPTDAAPRFFFLLLENQPFRLNFYFTEAIIIFLSHACLLKKAGLTGKTHLSKRHGSEIKPKQISIFFCIIPLTLFRSNQIQEMFPDCLVRAEVGFAWSNN